MCGKVSLCRKVFKDTLNESREMDRGGLVVGMVERNGKTDGGRGGRVKKDCESCGEWWWVVFSGVELQRVAESGGE